MMYLEAHASVFVDLVEKCRWFCVLTGSSRIIFNSSFIPNLVSNTSVFLVPFGDWKPWDEEERKRVLCTVRICYFFEELFLTDPCAFWKTANIFCLWTKKWEWNLRIEGKNWWTYIYSQDFAKCLRKLGY